LRNDKNLTCYDYLLLNENCINYAHYKVKLPSNRFFFLRNANDETTTRTNLDNINSEATIGKSPAWNYCARPQSINLRTRLHRLQLYRRCCDSDDLRRTLLHESRIRDESKWTILGHGRSARETARDRGRYLKLVLHESVESATIDDCDVTSLVRELQIMNNKRLISDNFAF